MLVWPFDLIVTSDDAEFSDPVVAFGVNAQEFFVHVYEVGHRKAKEILFTGPPLANLLGVTEHERLAPTGTDPQRRVLRAQIFIT